jgi:hypothetical protein
MSSRFDPKAARAALAALPDVAAQETLQPPSIAQVFVPKQHPKALSIDSSVVVGMRGAGKSFWTAVLATDAHRRFVAKLVGQPLLGDVKTRVGFGLDDTNTQFPGAEVIARLLKDGQEPIHIWFAVVIRHALDVLKEKSQMPNDWGSAVEWISNNAEAADDILTKCDAELKSKDQTLLVLFDAFDRLSTNWDDVRSLTRDALRLCLRCRSRRSIRLKFFLRPDLEEDAEIWEFADSSKLRHSKVELSWKSADLYALVVTHLLNSGEFGERYRLWATKTFGVSWKSTEDVFVLPDEMSSDEALQEIIEALTDEFMGRDRKRGYTYTWIPTHLADAVGRITPRSYLLAFKRAAEKTAERFSEHSKALHYLAIHDGVIAASDIRVREINEDYPWVQPLLEAARGLVVPSSQKELTQYWTPDSLKRLVTASKKKLPPRRYSTDPLRKGKPDALLDDLVELAIVYRTHDHRLNVPDIFRVGFGIKRKGGVKPPR